jgi:alkaline phosphatase D
LKKKWTKFHGATHGFDPIGNARLSGFFIAAGPNITKGRVLKPFKNIHVFPLMNTLLGFNKMRKIDGQKSVLESIIE